MSTLKHPVGPQPGRVYWRRRLLALLGLIAVVVIVVLIVTRPGSGSGHDDPKAKALTGETPKATSEVPDTSSTTIPTTDTATDGAPCKPANIKVEALTDATSYAAGKHPLLSLSLTNTGPKSCTMNAGTSKQVYTITSGSETYWVSTDCQKDPVDTKVLLAPNKTVTSTPIPWDRTRSDPSTCDAKRDPVPAGGASYHLKTSVDGISSEGTKQFLLH